MARLKDEEIKNKVYEVIREYGEIKSLNEIKRYGNLKVSNKRIIRALISLWKEGKIKVYLTTSFGIYEKCPLCNSELDKVYVTNLLGNKEIVGFRCKNCFYRCELGKMRVRRYKIVIK